MGAAALSKKCQALVDALAQVGSGFCPDVVPDGWMSTADLEKHMGWQAHTIRLWLQSVPHERRKFKVQRGARLLPVPHYRLSVMPPQHNRHAKKA